MSRQAGYQAVKRCGIPVSEDGKVDKLVADTLYLARTRARARNVQPSAAETRVGAPVPPPGPTEPLGGPSDEVPSQLTSRARKEAADAEMAEIEAARRAGRLIDRESTERGVFDAYRTLRDQTFLACKNAAPLVIGLTELREVHQVLEDCMRQAFADFEKKMQLKLAQQAGS